MLNFWGALVRTKITGNTTTQQNLRYDQTRRLDHHTLVG